MSKVHALQESTPSPLRRTVVFCKHSRVYTIGFVLNLILIPFKAYISEPLPWTVKSVTLNTTWLDAKDATSFDKFATATVAFLAAKYNYETVPPNRVFLKDANSYVLRFTLALPPTGDDNCVHHMHRFPGALLYSHGTAKFVCTFVGRNTTTRFLYPMHQCQYDTFAGVNFAVSCTWATTMPSSDEATYAFYHGVQLLVTPSFTWMVFCVRCGLFGFILHTLWRQYYRHYGPLATNLATFGLDERCALYVIQLGDPASIVLSHPFVSLVMVLDCLVNCAYAGAANSRASQLTDVGQFCLGCLYGSRTVWASYMAMRYATPLLKSMQWEKYFDPVDPGMMALTVSFYAGPLVYLMSRTPFVWVFQWLNSIALPLDQTEARLDAGPGLLFLLVVLATVPIVNSFVAQSIHRRRTRLGRSATEKFVTTHFNDWKHRFLFRFRCLDQCSRNEGGTLYRIFGENPRYKKVPLVSTRGSDCFIYGWDETAGAFVHQVRLSLIHVALDTQTTCPALVIPICPTTHPTYAANVIDAQVCAKSPLPPSQKILHRGANNCQWMK
ncbi:Aste57867_19763 [Aphanomyces stellatus]|uniref:Aste57867_19763 protein n=1 Tax=Aphanomyces stellatus TaxID=120398 RepID=A0A485LHY4_9STRA|nr:hypothetical protein As57867_019698 [Aphanomyces stellatus]VFT96461.1 Aste57867_19763 [Aphanomyces stellatus]